VSVNHAHWHRTAVTFIHVPLDAAYPAARRYCTTDFHPANNSFDHHVIFLYPETRSQIEIMVMAMIIGCLMSVWFAFGRGWWLARAGVAMLVVLTFLPIGAYQPIVWFVVSMVATVSLLIPLRLWVERAAVPLNGALPEPRRPAQWPRVSVVIASLLLAFGCLDEIVGRAPAFGWRERSLVIVAVFFSSWLIFHSLYERVRTRSQIFDSDPCRPHSLKFSLLDSLLVTGVLALAAAISLLASTWIMAATGWFFGQIQTSTPLRTSTKVARVAMGLLSLLVLACLVPTYAKMTGSLPARTFTSEPAEQSNYRELVSEISKLQRSGTLSNQSDEQPELATLDSLLEKPIAVWGDNELDRNLGTQLNEFRAIARRLARDATQATREGRHQDALESAMRCVRLGSGLSRGGSLSHLLTDISMEGVGYEHFPSVLDQIPIDEIPELLTEWRTMEQNRESIASIRASADLECERTLGWRYRLSIAAWHRTAAKPENCHTIVTATVQATEEAIARRDISQRLITTELAIRIFTATHDRCPATLSELVPDLLRTMPLDPYSDGTLVYRVEENGFMLYSVGYDGVDNGGIFGTIAETYRKGFDFNIDVLSRP